MYTHFGYIPVQSNKSQCHKLTFMHHENNVHLGVYMIIKLESTEFIFSGFVVFPTPPNKYVIIHTHAGLFLGGGDDLVLSISIFILGPHWWHHRGYHQRHRRSCYKDVWYRNIGMTRYNHDVFMIYMVSWHDEQRHHENVFYKDLWYRKTCATCRHVLLEKHDGSCCIDFWNGKRHWDFLLFYHDELKN